MKVIQKNIRMLRAVIFTALSVTAFQAGAWANVLGNANFELELGSGTQNNWDNTNGAQRVTNATLPAGGFSNVPEGQFALEINNATDFTFQLNDHVKGGDVVVFSGLAESSVVIGGGAQGGRFVIEFKQVFEETNTDRTLQSAGTAFITTTNAPAGGGYQRFTVTAQAPEGTERVAFVINSNGGAAGFVVVDDVSAEINPAKFNVFPSKSEVEIGEPVLFHIQLNNPTDVTLSNVQIHVDVPSGFHVDPDSARVNGQKASTRQGSFIMTLGDIGPNATVNSGFVAVAGSAAVIGQTYTFEITANDTTFQLSEKAFVKLRVRSDPLFDEGTIIGKVFNDTNQNGVQDEGEEGVPAVQLVTEEGIRIVTDQYGRYHVPGIKPGRHIVKIVGHSLPAGTKFITEESYLIRTTPGIMSKANFAVLLPPSDIPEAFREDLQVRVTQGLDFSRPVLGVEMAPEVVRLGVGVLAEDPVFKFHTNYPDYIRRWYLEIRDSMGREVWTGFGVSVPPAEVSWSGETEDGTLVRPGVYSYQFKVEDTKGHQDWTPLHFFRVVDTQTSDVDVNLPLEIPSVGDFNIFEDGKRSIPLVAKPTLKIQGQTRPGNQVRINQFPVQVEADGRFLTELYVMPGEKDISVTSTTPEGESVTYSTQVEVRDSMFFMTALGEQEMGYNFASGNLETVGEADTYKDGFYQDGRLSYYLMGKIKGKFLVRSHYDTDGERSSLFTNLDPESYYPVYGDASQRDYEAQDTTQKFFMVVEWDRSFAKWGSFETDFNDTELATYNRTLSGLKVAYEDLETTPYGDPKKAMKVIWSKTQNRGDHNEFLGTGGTLYYLRNRNVIQGSEKIRVEIRDKIQNISLVSYDLKEGKDYEIDYEEGRILLSRPLSSVAASDVLFSESLLDGNETFLVVDYEFDAGLSAAFHANRGIRGYTHFGDHLKIGGTAIEEQRRDKDYDLRAIDATLKVGRNTKITAEYAESKLEQVENAVSFNGGLTFADLDPIQHPEQRERENAYLIKAESQPVKNLELAGYVQGVEPGFSTDRIRSQEGTKKYGISALYRFTPRGYIRYRYDYAETSDSLLPIEERNVFAPFESLQNQILQAAYDNGKWFAQAEYLQRSVELPNNNLVPTLLSEVPFEHGAAAKVGWHVNERLRPYVKVQTTLNGKSNHQFGGGFRYEVTKDIFAYVEQMFGTLGDSTLLGFERQYEGGGRTWTNLKMRERGIGLPTLTTAIGSSFPLTEKSRIYSEREHSTYESEDRYADILGIDGHMDEHWTYEIRFERQHLKNSTTRLLDQQAEAGLLRSNSFNTVYTSLGYADGDKFRTRTAVEVRRDNDSPDLWQIASRNSLDYKYNEDLSFRSVLNFGVSRFRNPHDRPADFMEFNTGFAYRPVDNDRFNVLGRYTYLRDISNDAQFESGLAGGGVDSDEIAHIVSLDVAYELHRYLGMVDKIAYKRARLRSGVTDNVALNSFLWAHRFNFHVTSKWDVAVEYRIFVQQGVAKSLRHGALFEVDREFYDYVRVGVGYDFTDFDDDLTRSNNFKSHGPFVRLTGKF